MKILLAILFTMVASHLYAGELDAISLVEPVSFQKPSSQINTVRSRLLTGVARLLNIDVKAKAKKQIEPYYGDLKGYFKSEEDLNAFVNKVIDGGVSSSLSQDKLTKDGQTSKVMHISDKGLIAFYRHLGNELVGGLMDKILEAEGLTNKTRRTAWIGKLTSSFNKCIDVAVNSQWDADHCIKALSASILPNMGVALVYELSKENLSPLLSSKKRASFNGSQAEGYKGCISQQQATTASVKDCAVKTMKSGVLKISDGAIEQALSAKVTESKAKEIKKVILPGFKNCIEKIGINEQSKVPLRDQFNDCVTYVTKEGGSSVVVELISNHELIKSSYPKEKLPLIAKEKSNAFKKCLGDDASKKKIDKCTESLTIATAKELTEINFSQKLREFLETARISDLENGVTPLQISEEDLKVFLDNLNKTTAACLDKEVKGVLDDDINSCAKASTKEIVLFIAKKRFDLTTAKKYASRPGDLKPIETQFYDSLNKCLDSKDAKEFTITNYTDNITPCTNDLTDKTALAIGTDVVTQALAENLADLPKRSFKKEREKIKTEVIGEFSKCLAAKRVGTPACTDQLLRSAAQSIVPFIGQAQVEEALSTSKLPTPLLYIEDEFFECTNYDLKGEKLTEHVELCSKTYALDLARALGKIKLNSTMEKTLGSDEFKKQKITMDALLDQYNLCLNEASKYDLQTGLAKMIKSCAEDLTRKATTVVKTNMNNWMVSEKADPKTTAVKSQFTELLPCLNNLLPASPYDEDLKVQNDSTLKVISTYLGKYVEYDPEKANQTVNGLMAQFSSGLAQSNDTQKTKSELIDFLYSNGSLTEFTKAMVQMTVKEALDKMPEKEMPHTWKDTLLNKQNFDEAFSTPEGSAITYQILREVLKPIVLENKKIDSPDVKASAESIKNKVIDLLVNTPNFGEKIISLRVQREMDKKGTFTRFIARNWYGVDTLNWSKVRLRPEGKIAEDYMKKYILAPRFKGVPREGFMRTQEELKPTPKELMNIKALRLEAIQSKKKLNRAEMRSFYSTPVVLTAEELIKINDDRVNAEAERLVDVAAKK